MTEVVAGRHPRDPALVTGPLPVVGRGGLAPDLVASLLATLPSGVVVVGPEDDVVLANAAAAALGIVAGERLAVERLRRVVGRTRRDGSARDGELDLPAPVEPPLRRPRPGAVGPAARYRTLPIGAGYVALVLDDLTEARRVDAVRHDFVANVSHELKTPVGAMHVLSEAIIAAADEPEAVRRFAGRLTHESHRLGRLVQEIIDLSRLQGGAPLPTPEPVLVETAVTEAVDRTRLAAQARDITVVAIGGQGCEVMADEGQLATAIANLVDNAVAYSPTGTRVVIGVMSTGDEIAISVADEGIGIAEKDQERVFERFYRADPARSRDTGGTGLGLAIVKHIATNHGGSVSVWSAEGAGSTFTLRLPARGPEDPCPAEDLPAAELPTAEFPDEGAPT